MQSKLSKIKTLFLRRMTFSLLTQLIFVGLVIITVKFYMKENTLNNLSDTLLISDKYTIDLISSYIELNEIYSLQLELHDIGDMRKLDSIEFSPYLPKFSFKSRMKLTTRKSGSYIVQLSRDTFQGVTAISFRGKILGYIITRKQYNEYTGSSISYDLFLVLVTACIAFVLNFVFLFLSLRNRILRNTSQLINAATSAGGSDNLVNIDIREYRLLADKIMLAKSENEKLLKQKALAETAATVAHDIRSPLAVMEMHLNKVQLADLAEHLPSLKKSVDNIRAVANNLLNRYRNQSDDNQQDSLNLRSDDENESRIVAIQPLIAEIVNDKLNEWAEANIKIEIKFDTAWLCLVSLPIIGLKRVLSNLLNNALEAMSYNGCVNIITHQADGSLIISIKDNGVGISASQINSALLGKSTKHNGKGLGLSTAVDFMQQVRGTLIVKSAENMGTEVVLSAPLISPPNWYPQEMIVRHNCTIICSITDPVLLVVLQKRLRPFFVNLKFFPSYLDTLDYVKSIESNHLITLVFDSITQNHSSTLQEIKDVAHGLECDINFYLISENPNNIIVQKYVREHGMILIPKSLVEVVPIFED